MSKRWEEEMKRRRAHRGSIQDRLLTKAEAFKAEALAACRTLKGADLEKAKADIEKRYWEIATGKTDSPKGGKPVGRPTST